MADLELVTGILLDPENEMLIVHREDHGQWELPGGKVLTAEQLGQDVDEPALARLSLRHILSRKIQADFDPQPANLPLLLDERFEQGDASYRAWVYQVIRFSGALRVGQEYYDKHDFVYPLERQVLRRHVSPVIRKFQYLLNNREIELQFNPWDTVQ